jgi:hypothetical protein
MNITEETVKQAIKEIPDQPTELLVHHWKCAITVSSKKEQKLLEPYIKANEKERKKRRPKPAKEPQNDSNSEEISEQ